MNKITGVAGVAALLALLGCAGDTGDEDAVSSTQGPVTTVSPTTEQSASSDPDTDGDDEEPDGSEAIVGYIEAVASARPSTASAALEYAAPDSVAYAYLQHQINIFEAALDGGLQFGDSTVEAIDGGCEDMRPGRSRPV